MFAFLFWIITKIFSNFAFNLTFFLLFVCFAIFKSGVKFLVTVLFNYRHVHNNLYRHLITILSKFETNYTCLGWLGLANVGEDTSPGVNTLGPILGKFANKTSSTLPTIAAHSLLGNF